MKLLSIVKHPDPILLKKAEVVTDFGKETLELIDSMLMTMKHCDGCGLAANQVNVLQRIITIDTFPLSPREGWLGYMINPEILELTGFAKGTKEGCLSFPDKYVRVVRRQGAVVKWQDIKGRVQRRVFSGISAVVIQHEINHLEGILFTSYEKD